MWLCDQVQAYHGLTVIVWSGSSHWNNFLIAGVRLHAMILLKSHIVHWSTFRIRFSTLETEHQKNHVWTSSTPEKCRIVSHMSIHYKFALQVIKIWFILSSDIALRWYEERNWQWFFCNVLLIICSFLSSIYIVLVPVDFHRIKQIILGVFWKISRI